MKIYEITYSLNDSVFRIHVAAFSIADALESVKTKSKYLYIDILGISETDLPKLLMEQAF